MKPAKLCGIELPPNFIGSSMKLRIWNKTADFETRQNSRFSKRDKTADFQNGTKQPIFETEQNSRFSKRNKTAVSQAAACDGTLITTTATDQGTVPGTLPTF